MDLKDGQSIEAFAVIVDINQYSAMVRDGEGQYVAQFVGDVLDGGIVIIQKEGGEIVGIMGDAFLAVIPTVEAFISSAIGIAKDIDRHCEYISNAQSESKDYWPFAKGGASLKITAEFGFMEISQIQSRFLGKQLLFAGNAITHAARISEAGTGNRCLLGPSAAKLVENAGQPIGGPYHIAGKGHEGEFEYFELDLNDIWLGGPRMEDEESFLG